MRIFILFLSLFFISCAGKLSELKEPKLNEASTAKLRQNNIWWQEYELSAINSLLDEVLKNNAQINSARINLLSAVARYKLVNFDMYPNLSGNLAANIAENLNLGTQSNSFSGALNLSYELDIYAKLYDEKKSAQLSAKASEYELESLQLTLANQALSSAFEYVYFNDVKKLLEDYINNLEEARQIYALKYELGKIEELDLLNIEQSLLNARQNLLSNAQNKELMLKNLKDLLGKEESFFVINELEKLNLGDFKELSLDFDLPLEALSYRPDVRAKASSLNAAFRDHKAVQKSMFPSISLGSSLSGSSSEFNETFKLLNLGGTLQISLPFLDYGRVRQNIQISRLSYESLKIEYEQALQSALNEFYLCLKDYEFYAKLYENIKLINEKQALITQAYLQKYELGRVELKDYLDAKNAFINSAQEILRSRLNVLKNINSYYQITALNLAR